MLLFLLPCLSAFPASRMLTRKHQTQDEVWEKNGKSRQPAPSHSRHRKWLAFLQLWIIVLL